MSFQISQLDLCLAGMAERVVGIQSALCALPAVGPENGGQGEASKAALLQSWLEKTGIFKIRRLDSPDSRVESGLRPNIIAEPVWGEGPRLWLFGHMDVVPPGDLSSWTSDPWILRREGDFIYGRGVEDNQQALASMLVLAECLARQASLPPMGLGLVFMADEECGSRHGLSHILARAGELFAPHDYLVVPDGGCPDGSEIEIAEKAQLWLKFTILGRQCHASAPERGVNAFLAASGAALALAGLSEKFPQRNPLFSPPFSTFVPGRHEENVESVNIVPGRDVFYMDCRLLPEVEMDAVEAAARDVASRAAEKWGARAEMEVIQAQAASSSPADTPAMKALCGAIEAVYGIRARPVGIGGATVAAQLRARSLPALVWSKIRNSCHQPDEYSSIAATLGDARVFGHILAAGRP